ncbi:MAG: hypothetical protein Q8O89_05290 [Nanoarchaeota archaeon]|nr:hypothetical protein [Nanoarchaeota archaeon]
MAETVKLKVEEKALEPNMPWTITLTRELPLKTPHRIKYDGIFDWEGLYRMIYDWMMFRGYYFEEVGIKHKVPNPMGAEIKYELSGWRKTTPYMMEWIRIYVIFYDLREVEVVKEGKKKKLAKGKMIMEVYGNIETDWQHMWDKTMFGKYLKEMYDKFIMKKQLEVIWWDRLYYTMYKLHTDIKNFLDMENRTNSYYDVW